MTSEYGDPINMVYMQKFYQVLKLTGVLLLSAFAPALTCFGQGTYEGEPVVEADASSMLYKFFTSYTGTATPICGISPGSNNEVVSVQRTPMGIYATIKWKSIGTYMVSFAFIGGGTSGSMQVTVYPGPPTVNSMSGCSVTSTSPSGIILSATAGNGGTTVRFYNNATDVTPNFTPNGPTGSVTVHAVANTTMYVSTYNSNLGIESLTRRPITATIIPEPQATPTVSGNVVIGPGEPMTLHASTASSPSYNYRWYSSSGTLLYTGQDYQTTSPAVGTIADFVHATYTNSGCDGPIRTVSMTTYSKPVITGTAIAQGSPTTLTCNADYQTYTWYREEGAAAVSGTTGNTCVTAALGRYKVVVTKNGVSGESVWFDLTSQFGNQNENLIVVNTIQRRGVTTAGSVASLSNRENIQSVQYFDGLGRPKQTVATQASPAGQDIIQPVVYDAQGREYRKYLPVLPGSTDGWYKANVIDASGNYTGVAAVNVYNNGPGDKVADDSNPYAETLFEASPLNRVFKQGAVGDDWQPETGGTYATASVTDHSIKKAYEVNIAGEVMWLKYNMQTRTVELGGSDYYEARTLQVSKTKDEHNHEVIEYIDREGHLVMKKAETLVDGVKAYAETYYVYDDFGRQAMVVPPEASERMKLLLISEN